MAKVWFPFVFLRRDFVNSQHVHKFKLNPYYIYLWNLFVQDFMIQGGDPTGTGRGGTSIYGKTFDDEIHSDLKHTGAGILR